jgi:antirestriction protein ArdC
LLKKFSCSEKIDLNSESRAIIEKIKCSKVVEITNCGGRAFYSRLNDSITLPEEHYFSDSGAYLSVLLHEIVHWSGAEKRLNRQKGKIFGDECYAKEELVAELGAAFLSATLKISNTVNEDLRGDNHAAYLNSWLNRVDFNLRSLEPYANKAKKASDYILNEILMCKPSKLLG